MARPVQVPCFCPTQPLDELPGLPGVEDAAIRAAVEFLAWEPADVERFDVYRIGDTDNAYGDVLGFSLGTFCDPVVSDRSLGVELWNPTVGQAGYYAAVVVGRFPSGWSVWGSYRGGPLPSSTH